MSCSSYSVHVIGLKLKYSELVVRKINPLYGKFKFDPDTGKKVTPEIEDISKVDCVQKWLDINDNPENNLFRLYDHDGTIFYGAVTKIVTDNSEYKKLTENHIDSLPKNYQDFISYLNSNSVSYEEGSWLIAHLSC